MLRLKYLCWTMCLSLTELMLQTICSMFFRLKKKLLLIRTSAAYANVFWFGLFYRIDSGLFELSPHSIKIIKQGF